MDYLTSADPGSLGLLSWRKIAFTPASEDCVDELRQRRVAMSVHAALLMAAHGDAGAVHGAIASGWDEARKDVRSAESAEVHCSEAFLVGDPANPARMAAIEGERGFLGWDLPDVVREVRLAT